MFTQILGINKKSLTKVFFILGLIVLANCFCLGGAFAQGEEEVVNDFADFMIDILTGPVSRILAAFILVTGVFNLIRGRQDIAVACALAFAILIFLPTLIESFQ